VNDLEFRQIGEMSERKRRAEGIFLFPQMPYYRNAKAGRGRITGYMDLSRLVNDTGFVSKSRGELKPSHVLKNDQPIGKFERGPCVPIGMDIPVQIGTR
jgi:hypothetical protein